MYIDNTVRGALEAAKGVVADTGLGVVHIAHIAPQKRAVCPTCQNVGNVTLRRREVEVLIGSDLDFRRKRNLGSAFLVVVVMHEPRNAKDEAVDWVPITAGLYSTGWRIGSGESFDFRTEKGAQLTSYKRTPGYIMDACPWREIPGIDRTAGTAYG